MVLFKKNFLCCLFVVSGLYSCSSYKKTSYFQNLDRTRTTQELAKNYSPLIIQRADLLGINVVSRNPESLSLFNYRTSGNPNDVSNENPFTGFKVDDNGNIHLPLLGTIKASGLTTSQLRDTLNPLLTAYYKDPVVNVRLLNFKVSVFGDVDRPNIYSLENERVTITEVLSLAGDLNITAKRKILLIREENGQMNFIPIDLTSKDVFESPYYYLKNNDEIYVEPDKTKYAIADDRGYRTATLILSGLSIIAIVLSNLYRSN